MSIQPIHNNKICKKCQSASVSCEGTWERCYSCGEIYSKRGIEMQRLDDIVVDTHVSTKTKYMNKLFFFLTA